MINGLASAASREDVFAAQGLLVACVPGVYIETPDGQAGGNTLKGMRACASKANSALERLEPEQRRLQLIVEEGASTVETGTGFNERLALAIALILLPNIFAAIGGLWINRAKEQADDEAEAQIVNAKTGELQSIADFQDDLIAALART